MQCLSDRRNDQTGHKADKQTCNDAGDHKYREIEKQIQVLDNEYSYQNLANVVADAAATLTLIVERPLILRQRTITAKLRSPPVIL